MARPPEPAESAWSGRIEAGLVALALAVGVAYLCGLWVVDVARGVAVAAALWMLWLVRRRHALPAPRPLWSAGVERGVVAGLWALWALCTGHLLGRFVLGEHGIDFAIFSQAVDGLAREGVARVTLVGLEARDFLTHHFVPYLWAPALLARAGLHPSVAALLVHAAGMVLGFGSLYGAFRTLGLLRTEALAWLLVAALQPALRGSFGWTMNDELYGAPFVVLALWRWLRADFLGCALALGVSCLCKESFPLVALAFCAMAWLAHPQVHPGVPRARVVRALLPVALLAVAIAAVYLFLQPLVFGKSFDHADKLATRAQWLDAGVWGAKLGYLAALLLPTLGLPLLTPRGRLLLLPALPGVALSMVSGFDEMYRPFNYYAVTPLLVGLVAAAASFAQLRSRLPVQLVHAGFVLLWAGALSFKPVPYGRTVLRALREPWRSAGQLSHLSARPGVAVDPAAAPFLLGAPHLTRMHAASHATPPPALEVLVWKQGGYEEPAPALLEGMRECGSTPLWQVRCREATGAHAPQPHVLQGG